VNKLIVILVVVITVIIGVAIAYYLQIEPAVQLIKGIQETIGGITKGGLSTAKLDLPTIASGASLATAATTAIGWVKSNKDKLLAQKQAIEQQVQNSGLKEQYDSLTVTKKQLEEQANELIKQKDDALAASNESANKIALLEEQVKKLRQTVDIYNTETIPNLKQKIIEKTIVK